MNPARELANAIISRCNSIIEDAKVKGATSEGEMEINREQIAGTINHSWEDLVEFGENQNGFGQAAGAIWAATEIIKAIGEEAKRQTGGD